MLPLLEDTGENCLRKLRHWTFCWSMRTRIEPGEGPHAPEVGLTEVPEQAARQDHILKYMF